MNFPNVRIFQLPSWLRYVTAVGLTLFVAILRLQVNPMLGWTGAFVFFSVPVAIAAFIGGFGPGLVATILSLLAGTFLFLIPNGKFPTDDTQLVLIIASNALVWLFITVISDLFRSAAINYKQAAQERDEGEERMSKVVDSMTDGFFAVDQSWKVLRVNSAFKALVGCDLNVEEGSDFWILLGPYRDKVRDAFLKAQAENSPASLDVQATGSDRWLHFRVFTDNLGMAGYVQDATFRKHIELHKERILANEKQARAEAERASQLKDEFIATLSHELRTPLTSILGWTEILQTRLGADDRAAEGLESIERSTKLQTQLVEELLDMSRMSVGKLRLQLEVVELNEVVQEAVNANMTGADANGVNLKIHGSSEDVYVKGDPSRLQQIASNLISNAIKFTERGGNVDVRVFRSGAAATITVTDTGQGIDPSFLPYLFDRFRQANASITRSRGGLGLGLAIVKQLVDMHGGTVRAMSEGLGRGSEFRVMIPVTPFLLDDEPGLPMETGSAVPVEGLQILIVDDDLETRNLLNIILGDAGLQVEAADSAQTALKILSTFRPDVIVSDIGMPEVDGYQFIRTVRNLPDVELSKTPSIALTAFAQQADKEKAIRSGFNTYMTKPIESKLLLSEIATLAGDRKKRPAALG